MKRILLSLFAVLLSLSAFADAIEIDGIYYNLDSSKKTATVTYKNRTGQSYTGDVIIPYYVIYSNVTYSVTSIGVNAFYNCPLLTSIVIPNSVTSIGSGSFWNCTGLTSIEIPNSVTSIGSGALGNCTSLTSIKIPNSVTSIAEGVFAGCTGLTSVIVEKGNSIYDSRNNCNAIIETANNTLISGCQNTIVPNSVTSIGIQAFSGCTGLTFIEIPNSVTSIGQSAFYGCKSLTTMMIPNSVTIIGDGAFEGCTGLTSIKIPNSVTSISFGAFWGCTGLTSMEIPNGVINIGQSAFYGCSGLTSIVIPNSVTSIEQSAFYGCTRLTSITCEAIKPPTLGVNAFYNVGKNCMLYVPAVSIESYKSTDGWKDFGIIKSIIISIDGIYYNLNAKTRKAEVVSGEISYSGPVSIPASITNAAITYNVTSIGEYAFRDCSGLTSIEIPNSITSIGEGTFRGCSGLTSMIIPNSITSISEGAFRDCSGLTSIVIPNSINSIGEGAFRGCSGLTSIEIPNSVILIGNQVFYGCIGLLSIEIPNSVTSIGNNAFFGCKGLTSIVIPNSVTSIGNNAFSGCNGLTSIEIPNSITSIGNQVFYNCKSLISAQIPNSVTSIGNYAFYNCKGLISIKIPNSVTSIGNNSFSGCNGLNIITCESLIPPTMGTGAFNNVDKTTCALYVPIESVEAYKSADQWKDFSNIIGVGEEGDDCYITIRTGKGGELQQAVELEQTYSYKVEPDEGCSVSSLTFNGEDMTSQLQDGRFSTPIITGDSELNVVFKQEASNINDTQNSVWDGISSETSWYDSSKSEYRITNAAQLKGLADLVNNSSITFEGKTIVLETDIDLNKYLWTPIGNSHNTAQIKFKGTFNGGGHTINNVVVSSTTNPYNPMVAVSDYYCVGLFGLVDGGTITKLKISGVVNIENGWGCKYVGGLVGYANNCSFEKVISNFTLNVKQENGSGLIIGGVAGDATTSSFVSVSSSGEVKYYNNAKMRKYFGGISGKAKTLEECASNFKIVLPATGAENCYIGGLSGYAGSVSNAIFTGSVAVSDYGNNTNVFVGGIVGQCGGNISSVISAPSSLSVQTQMPNLYQGMIAPSAACSSTPTGLYLSGITTNPGTYGSPISDNDLRTSSYLGGFSQNKWIYIMGEYPALKSIVKFDDESDLYYIIIHMGGGGSLKQLVELGYIYTYKVKADDGWTVNTLTFNGQDMKGQLLDGQFSTPVITGDSELNVVFKQEASNIKSMKQTETSKVKVYAYNGTIKVVGAEDDAEVEVYNTGGIRIADGEGNCSISLDSGIYIVKVGNETFKVSL